MPLYIDVFNTLTKCHGTTDPIDAIASLGILNDREIEVLTLYYKDRMMFADIANKLNISRQRAWLLKTNALAYLAGKPRRRQNNTAKAPRKYIKTQVKPVIVTEIIDRDNCTLVQNITINYRRGIRIHDLAKYYKISDQKVKKILISLGLYTNPTIKEIIRLRKKGKSVREIAEIIGIREQSVSALMPYEFKPYMGDDRSENAIKIKKWRDSKK
jgi:DNA-directed RNA polymerase specialized sigma subunit